MKQEYDRIGFETLEILGNASRFNQWLYKKISPYLGKTVLEIGSGLGNITSLIEAGHIFATDTNENYIQYLQNKFRNNPYVTVQKLDASIKEHYQALPEGIIDTILCCNVLEHIKDDCDALKNFFYKLHSSGTLILMVPYSQTLYCRYDKELGHFRRYSRKSIHKTVENAGFKVERTFLFNFFGGLGWFLMGKVLQRAQLDSKSINIYEKMVPIFSIFETFGVPFGSSIFCIARKQ